MVLRNEATSSMVKSFHLYPPMAAYGRIWTKNQGDYRRLEPSLGGAKDAFQPCCPGQSHAICKVLSSSCLPYHLLSNREVTPPLLYAPFPVELHSLTGGDPSIPPLKYNEWAGLPSHTVIGDLFTGVARIFPEGDFFGLTHHMSSV